MDSFELNKVAAAVLFSLLLVLGIQNHVEIWAPVRWDEANQALEDSSAFAEAISGLGI